MEIERKFLVRRLPENLEQYEKAEIEQGYIFFAPQVRARKWNDVLTLTIKSQGHMTREEFELPLTDVEYRTLYKKVDHPPLKKTRYMIPLGNGLKAELDIYKGNLEGLCIVEVEFPSEEEANNFQPPDWFGCDVTSHMGYKAGKVLTRGIPEEYEAPENLPG